ncbi:hypothetical protein FLA105534_03504 [Flavobacterium bizetiae]|uniref:Diadenosine tetraphosphate hydrolase n=1 Tax=Flavobacterium bizetiae TaxID=2704140 RepID=A0A6J4GPT5_9FLAO|nr:DUF4269 domain-containing protein [Flavobacterium bizetiae]CAA9201268.1 hypothetical protein FLA105534_03504 [Flavobacterium bizetiae]CAD5344065.1 hypothetical protein FLA105535_04069 [Flavobacterium bizetiae]CAD5350069.1 hypothetical protein FLA105534_04058 [Flavobacterium bizetiae]
MTDFSNIEYLKNGNKKQRNAFEVLTQHKILSNLAEFDPILVGTIPINIDIENSDLDIICYWNDKANFIEKIILFFGKEAGFAIREIFINGRDSVVANFKIENFEIEVFGQNIPTKDQNGYRHMLIENEILQSKGNDFRSEIIKLKQNGYKTEPAFAFLLGLKGDPYTELLEYKI